MKYGVEFIWPGLEKTDAVSHICLKTLSEVMKRRMKYGVEFIWPRLEKTDAVSHICLETPSEVMKTCQNIRSVTPSYDTHDS
jgi:hypothetical protein